MFYIIVLFYRIYSAYQSATQDDLWSHYTLTAQNQSLIPSTVTVKELMNSWSMQSGYPLVTITRNYSTGVATINQTKMTEGSNLTSDELWYIPITYITKTEAEIKEIWLEHTRETNLNLSGLVNASWILANIEETGKINVI